MNRTDILNDLAPVLIWMHSKKHDEKPSGSQWRLAWRAMAYLLYPDLDRRLHYLEEAAHAMQGLPLPDVCGCSFCAPVQQPRKASHNL